MNEDRLEISISDLESFAENRVWRLLVQAAISRTNEEVERIIGTSAFKDPDVISRGQGYIEGMNFMIDYPAVLKEQLEYQQQEETWKDGNRERD